MFLLYLLAANTLYGQICASFDGIDDLITTGIQSEHQISSNLTIEAWIKPSRNNGYEGIANNIFWTGL